jgi:hypothetical protein
MKNHNDYIGGIPDVWYSGTQADLWVEYKYLPISQPRAVVIPNLSPKQLHWITARRVEGRNVWVIVGYKPGGVIFDDLDDIKHGIQPDVFMDRTLPRKELANEIALFCLKEKHNE